jgi:hypothetical protein
VQSELNKAWAAEGGPVPVDDAMPAHLPTGARAEAVATPSESSEPAATTSSAERPPGT